MGDAVPLWGLAGMRSHRNRFRRDSVGWQIVGAAQVPVVLRQSRRMTTATRPTI